MLSITATNVYGQHRYAESCDGELHYSNLNFIDDFWTVETPSDELQKLYPENVKTIGNDVYLMSNKAMDNIPSKSINGALTCISTEVNGQKYYVLVKDNKKYYMNAGGLSDHEEVPLETAVRELKEELFINVDEKSMTPICEFSYNYTNALIGETTFVNNTYVFHIKVPFEEFEHLKISDDFQKVLPEYYVAKAPSYLNETQLILFVKASEYVPEQIDGFRYAGHHRGIVMKQAGHEVDFSEFNYLNSFTYYSHSKL